MIELAITYFKRESPKLRCHYFEVSLCETILKNVESSSSQAKQSLAHVHLPVLAVARS